jgi:hypothetical protein
MLNKIRLIYEDDFSYKRVSLPKEKGFLGSKMYSNPTAYTFVCSNFRVAKYMNVSNLVRARNSALIVFRNKIVRYWYGVLRFSADVF